MENKKKNFDLSTLDVNKSCNEAVEFELLHPATKEPLGMFVKIIGVESTVIRDFSRKTTAETLEELKEKEITQETTDRVEKRIINTALIATVAIRGFVLSGKEIENTRKEIEKIYNHAGYTWIVEQVYNNVRDLKLFM